MNDPTPDEQRIVTELFEHLKRKLAEGSLIMAGPCTDGAFGIVLFRADTEGDARAFMESDPAVRQGVMTAELHPFRLSLGAGDPA